MDLLTSEIKLLPLVTVLALLLGLMSLGQGGSFDRDFGTRFMWARVGLQGLAVGLLVLALLFR